MKFNLNQLKLARIAFIVCVAFIAIPITAHVSSTPAIVVERSETSIVRTATHNFEHTSSVLPAKILRRASARPQSLYERRRRYVEERVERRLDRRQEYLDRQAGNDDEDDSADNADDDEDDSSMADDEDSDSEDDEMDEETDRIERRREYLRDRADRGWR